MGKSTAGDTTSASGYDSKLVSNSEEAAWEGKQSENKKIRTKLPETERSSAKTEQTSPKKKKLK